MKQSPLPIKAEFNRHPLFKDSIISNKKQQIPLQPEKVARNITSNYQTELKKFYDHKINNDMLSEDKNPSKARSFRQDVHHVKYKDYPHEFIAYCLINKESNSGIFAHERLLVLDSYLQELRYYSTIPNLPLTNTEQLSNLAKETIKLSKVGKFSFTPVKNGIGEVTVSWKEGATMKEWKISMGNRRIAKQFSILIDEVRKKEHLLKNQAKMFQSRIIAQQNKVNLKTTPFIQQLAKLDQKRQTNVIMPKVSELQDQKIQSAAAVNVAISLKKQADINVHEKQENLQNDSMVKKPLQYHTLQSEQQNLSGQQKERGKRMPESPKFQIKQIKTKDVDMQHKQNIQNKESIKKQQLSQLQRILKSRRQELENSHLPNAQPQNEMSKSKVLIRQTPSSVPPKPQTSSKNQIVNHLSPKTYLSQNEDNNNTVRLSLLSQRRQSYQSSAGKKIAITQQTNPVRESNKISKEEVSINLKVEQKHEWLYKWVTAKHSAQKADIYCKFVNHCKAKVVKVFNTFQGWHLFQKSSSYIIYEQEVEYTCLMKKKTGEDVQAIQLQNMANFDYIMTAFGNFTNDMQDSHANSNNVSFAIPMICIINYKCLVVICKASQISTKISAKKILDRTNYMQKIDSLQKYVKIALQKSQLWQFQSNGLIWIYFKQLSFLPFVDEQKSIYIDGHYLSRYIKDGVIKNSYDLLAINNHLKTIFPTLLQTLEQSCPLSTIQLEQMINAAGLNLSFIAVLHQQALQMRMTKAASILISQIMAIILAQLIVSVVQQQLMNKDAGKNNIVQDIFPLISQYLLKSQPMIDMIKDNLSSFLKVQNTAFPDNTIDEYVMSSLLLKLGLRCEVKIKMNIQQLENMQFKFWRQIQFCPQKINLVHVTEIVTYHIQHFSQEWYSFITNDFAKEKCKAKLIQKEALFRLINIHPHRPYYESIIFQLMPKNHKIKLNFLLSLLNAPSGSEDSTFLSQFKDPYFNLCHHSTASIPTYYSFATDLAGLKWLIKKKEYQEVEYKMTEQIQRVWMWARNNPNILMQIYDLNSLFSIIYKKTADSMANSLKSLQISIYFFGKSSKDIWEVIWEKAYQAGNIHYDLNKIDQALQLYSTCARLIEEMPETKIQQCDIKQQLLNIYLKRCKLLVNLGRIQDCIDQCKTNMLRYAHWKSIFDPTEAEILSKIQHEEFETNLLQFRCYQIQNNAIEMIKIAEFCCIAYIEKDFSEESLSSYFCIETMKMMWIAIVSNANTSIENNHYLHRCYPDFHKMDLAVLGNYLATSQIKRNSINQMSEYIQIAITNQSQIANDSALVKLTLQSLSQISKSKLAKPSALNYETTKSNHLIFIKSFLRLIGQEFALGYIKSIVSQFGCY